MIGIYGSCVTVRLTFMNTLKLFYRRYVVTDFVIRFGQAYVSACKITSLCVHRLHFATPWLTDRHICTDAQLNPVASS